MEDKVILNVKDGWDHLARCFSVVRDCICKLMMQSAALASLRPTVRGAWSCFLKKVAVEAADVEGV